MDFTAITYIICGIILVVIMVVTSREEDMYPGPVSPWDPTDGTDGTDGTEQTVVCSIPGTTTGPTNPWCAARLAAQDVARARATKRAEVLAYRLDGNIEHDGNNVLVVSRWHDRTIAMVEYGTWRDVNGTWRDVVTTYRATN